MGSYRSYWPPSPPPRRLLLTGCHVACWWRLSSTWHICIPFPGLLPHFSPSLSRRDGAALAGALLEEMDRRCITGIFATHLHELFDLPLNTQTLSYKRMGIDWVGVGGRVRGGGRRAAEWDNDRRAGV